MRLIDADKLNEELYKAVMGMNGYRAQGFEIARNIVNKQDTAYDVEKVVEQIHDYFCKVIDDCEEDIVPHEILEYNKAICEIVRNGGME